MSDHKLDPEHKLTSEGSDHQIEDVELSREKRLDHEFSDIDKKKFLWKVDLHLIPWLCVLYRA